jgi:gliding motility-associated-like protein
VHQYTDAGVYTVTLLVVDENGCESFYELKDYITVTQTIGLWVPNAFTPNGDEINDHFNITTRLVTDIEITIFDRWGKVIFFSQDPNFQWDGKYGGVELPEGVYAYKIVATAYDGNKFDKAGSLTLIR